MGKREDKKNDLRVRLVEAASRHVSQNGLGSLRARDLAQEAGCALGAIYTIFSDLDELILHVNSRTLKVLEADLTEKTTNIQNPSEKLVALADAYLNFAYHNRLAWKAIFDHRLPETALVPQWYLSEHTFLVGLIEAPLAQLRHSSPTGSTHLRARTLFAAVHGVVTLSLDKTFIALDYEALRTELLDFVKSIVSEIKS